jgi:hypothetical protein
MEIIFTPETISYNAIAAVCDAADYPVTALEDGSLRVGATTTVWIQLSAKQDRLQIATYRAWADTFNHQSRSDVLCTINHESQLLKATLSNTGSLMISYEHYIVGGITADNLLAAIERSAVLCVEMMSKHAENLK